MLINSQIIAKQKRIINYNLSPSVCTHCRSDLEYDKRNNKFCNQSCAASFNNVFKTKHGRRAKKECSLCKTETTNARYCSKKCSGIAKTKYKSDEDRINAKRMLGREMYARYAARKKFQTPIDANLEEIKRFYLNCPDGYEVDHVIPISKGGLHTLSNLQYLTSVDNKRKGAKLNWRP